MLSGPVQATGGSPDDRAQLDPLRQVIVQPLLSVRDHVQGADTGAAYSFDCPVVDCDVVGVPGLTVRCKGQDRIRSDLANDLCDLFCCLY